MGQQAHLGATAERCYQRAEAAGVPARRDYPRAAGAAAQLGDRCRSQQAEVAESAQAKGQPRGELDPAEPTAEGGAGKRESADARREHKGKLPKLPLVA